MDPATVALLGEALTAALKAAPGFIAAVQAVRMSGTATPEQLAALDAQIETLDTLRRGSWELADAALSDAAAH